MLDIGYDTKKSKIYAVQLSSTKFDEKFVLYKGNFIPERKPPKNVLNAILTNPIDRRIFLATLFNEKPEPEIVEDESIYDFLIKNTHYWNEQDRDYIINTHIDAQIQAAYGGDIKKLSARSSNLFSFKFYETYKKEPIVPVLEYTAEIFEATSIYGAFRDTGSNCFRFEKGMKGFIDSGMNYSVLFKSLCLILGIIPSYLNKRKNIVVTNNFVKHIKCDKPEVVLKNGSVLQFDQIISTVTH